MRKPLIAGNWKMYKTVTETKQFVTDFLPLVTTASVDIAIFPPFVGLKPAAKYTEDSKVKVGGQNLYWETQGAYTGEISGLMLKELGCAYVLIGHSERRQYFGETDETVNKKIQSAFNEDLLPIFCIGETLMERENQQTFAVIKSQIIHGLDNIQNNGYDLSSLTIAYEPVWAIGTGKTASKQQAQEVHAYIRKLLADLFGDTLSQKIRILYGGSVKPENIEELIAEADIDGALVGGASLDPETFAKITQKASAIYS